ncbi:MAG: DNA primase [Candidatus Omnitrophica bacterium]|nr:DNA primase [Candidatus Omnitrophota bacterium]
MTNRIPENLLEDILSRVDIVELISGYIPLKKAGRNFKACCPFHREKTPSFMVSPERQIYHCFGCNESGNAFKFLMAYERFDFPEAVEFLARKTGVILPEKEKRTQENISITTQLFKINELACAYYQKSLDSETGSSARGYFLKRGIPEEGIKLFKLGFAEDKWDGLINYLRSKGVGLALLEKAGLAIAKDRGGFYDRFRNRAIFPIFDIKSRVLGFGARLLDETKGSTAAKYINSPESPVYTKGKNLYGLNLSKEAIRECDSVIMVEGYMDFIIPYTYGIHNIVASLGTALTEEQAGLLKRFTQNVVMVYDADAAGQMATLRALDIFIEEGMNVRIATLPAGMDPDLYMKKNGLASFKEMVNSAKSFFEYKLSVMKSRYNTKEIEERAMVAKEMLISISKFKDSIVKSEYIKLLAQELNVNEEALLEEINKIKGIKAPYNGQNRTVAKAPFNPTESLLIRLMLEESELIDSIRKRLEPTDFQDERTKKLVTVMFDLFSQGKTLEPNKIINYLDDSNSLELICKSAFKDDAYPEDKEKVVEDCIKLIKSKRLSHIKQRLQEEIRIAEQNKDEEKLHRLKDEFCELLKKGR